MRSFIIAALAMAFVAGCQKEETPPAQPVLPGKAPLVKANAKKEPIRDVISGVARRMEISEVRNLLRQLGQAYHTFDVDFNRAPRTLAELEPYLGKSASLIEPLKSGDFTVIYGVKRAQMTAGASNTIIAYETHADTHGQRVVLMGDGSLNELTEAEFAATPKAIGIK